MLTFEDLREIVLALPDAVETTYWDARSFTRPVQAGSSIMPGRVNPVIPEVVNQVAFQVIGNDLTSLRMEIPRFQTGFPRDEADDIVAEAARCYLEGCRARIDFFVERNFSVAGAARLHTRAVGWDLLKAPANVVLSVPQIGLKLGAAAARKIGAPKTAEVLGSRRLFLETAVAIELRWRLMTELLRLPFADGDRISTDDALAEAILAHPRVQTILAEAAASTAGSARRQIWVSARGSRRR